MIITWKRKITQPEGSNTTHTYTEGTPMLEISDSKMVSEKINSSAYTMNF